MTKDTLSDKEMHVELAIAAYKQAVHWGLLADQLEQDAYAFRSKANGASTRAKKMLKDIGIDPNTVLPKYDQE